MAPKKGQAASGAAKKQRVIGSSNDGINIMRFFDKQQAGNKHTPDASRLAPQAGQASTADCTPVGQPRLAAAAPKRLGALQDLGAADSIMMSQDTDAMQVVWHDSPGSNSCPAGRPPSNLGHSARGDGSAPSGPGTAPKDVHAIKQRLISAAQRPRDTRRPGAPAGAVFAAGGGAAGAVTGAARLLQSEQLLEGLLSRPLQSAQLVQGGRGSSAPGAQEQSGLSGGPSDVGGGVGGGGPHRTPGTHLRSILKRHGGGPGGSAGRHTPASSVRFPSHAGSTGNKGRRTGAGRLGSSGKKRQAGQKRKALLELLEQVESIVHSSGGSDRGSPGGGSPIGGSARTALAAVPEEELDGISDKENAEAGAAAACHQAGGSEGKAADAAGDRSSSQELMPPPGARIAAGELAAVAPTQPVDVQYVPSGAAPPQQQQAAPAELAAGASNVQGAGSGGGFGFAGDDDEDDALMAQLELELLTQVEQRQAARQAVGAVAAVAKHGRQGADGHAAAAPHAPARPQAAPPAAQHPAAAPQQQEQQLRRPVPQPTAAGAQAPGAQPKALPRSPYEKQGLARLEGAPAAPPGMPPAAAGAGGPAQAGAGMHRCDSGWDDDMEDLALLDQFEAAALKERADRGGPGQAPGDGAKGREGEQQQDLAVGKGGAGPPAGADARRPSYPGNREEVHYTIREIFPGDQEQVLLVHNKYQKRDVYAHLRAPWCDLPYRVGDTVNILADLDFFEGHHHCLLGMDRGMLILHPDVLLSGTRITTSHECSRRSYLDETVAGEGSNDKAVKGTLTHNLIQAALTEGLRTPQQLAAAAERVVRAATELLLEAELTEEAAMECLRAAVPGIIRWMHRFMRPDPAPDSLLFAGYDYATGRDVKRAVSVAEVVDIEESIWSTKYGVKGMIDVSARLTLDDPAQQQQQRPGSAGAGWVQPAAGHADAVSAAASAGRPGRELAVGPVEIKTGKKHESHKAQVLLYLLLMEERYGKPLEWGMLWYTHQTDPELVVKRPMDLACLMAVRNRMAAAIAHRELPPLSDEKRQCNWCFQQHNCALAFKAERGVQGGTADAFVRGSGDRGGNLDRSQQELAAKFERAAGHMTAADCEFLKKWEALVTLEEAHSTARRPEIWAMAGEERQALGRCVAGLALAHVDEEQLLYTFCRPDGGAISNGFQEGEMLLVSVEGQHAAVARGFFYTCTATHLTISLNKALRKGLLKPGGTSPDSGGCGGGAAQCDPSVRWRLDRDDVSSTYVRLRGNLYALFRRDFEGVQDPQTGRVVAGPHEADRSLQAARLRQLVVALEAPRVAPVDPTQPELTPPGMNSEQHAAVRRVLSALDYTLVLGMPGAGKTTTIVSMVQALVAQGKSVLLTSYTNSAVDNILMKLAREGVPFVRLGRESGVHPAVRPWLPGGERYPRKTTRELAKLAETIPVVGATCFGVHHAMLKDRMFDVCIIDEAGQMVLPASLGPLLKARSFVLVGDHNQLPPLVASREAAEGGLGESLFKRLSDAHPEAVVQLPVQYRMAADIMLLPNTLIYDGALRCGTDGIAEGTLQLGPGAGAVLASLPPWLQAALDPQRRVLFLDTAQVEGAREAVAGDAVSNPGEVRLVMRLLRAAAAAGVQQDDVGVISPYRSQVALLDRRAREAGLEGVEVLTVDKCQGRDKACVVLSLVRSNAEGEAGKLLADWRRINVAITRAKTKLVLVGDAATLANIQLFAQLVALTKERGWHLQLPPTALADA